MKAEVHIFSRKEVVIEYAAGYLIQTIKKAIANQGQCTIALSGGSTPRSLYARLASPALLPEIPWEQVQLFWGDERAVPPGHPDSNYGMVKEALLQHIQIPVENVHRIKGELESRSAAEEYTHELHRHFGKTFPQFDVVLLGMGADGHTASLFPGTTIVKEKEKIVSAVFVPSFNSWRISLTLPVINNAGVVMFIITGKNKSEMLRKIFTLDKPSLSIPASLVKPERGKLLWMLDSEAAALLNNNKT